MLESPGDRLPSIRDPLEDRSLHPLEDLVHDEFGVLRSGIVRGYDREIGTLGRDAPHLGSLRPVPVPSRTEYDDQPSAAEGTKRLEDPLECVRGVCVVQDHGHRIRHRHLEAPLDGRNIGERPGGHLQFLFREERGSDRRERVFHIETAEEGKGDPHFVTTPPHPEAAPFPR